MNILFVEDDRNRGRALHVAPSRSGHTIHSAGNGNDGLAEVKRWSSDLILTDVETPTMDGLRFCKTIRRVSRVPIIVLSAARYPALMAEALDAGADDYVIKPFSIPILEARIRGFMRRSGKT